MSNPLYDLISPLAQNNGAPHAPPAAPAPRGPSKGQIIAGIIADGLRGLTGQQGIMPGIWAKQREAENEQAQWHNRRTADLEDYGRKLEMQNDPRYAKPDISPMERDVAAWGRMGPEQQAAYQQMQQMRAPDPDIVTTLPNGQLYAGPRSGLAAALGGSGPTQAKTAPRGKLTPVNGGPTPQASGGFPRF